MSEQTALIPDLIRQTFSDPRGAAGRIIRLELPGNILWEALALVVVMSVITAQITSMMFAQSGIAAGEETTQGVPAFLTNPLLMTFIQGVILVVMIYAVHLIGRSFGGIGHLEGAIALIVWLQFLLVCLQVAQAFMGMLSPALSGFIGLIGVVAFFWLLTQFVLVLHGFQSAAMVFVMIVVSMLALVFALSMVLTLLGVAVVVGEVPDV
ncbi:MAG: YIP1 family protein [Pseudomonadota bacterium]